MVRKCWRLDRASLHLPPTIIKSKTSVIFQLAILNSGFEDFVEKVFDVIWSSDESNAPLFSDLTRRPITPIEAISAFCIIMLPPPKDR
jgi:hypothetical protein